MDFSATANFSEFGFDDECETSFRPSQPVKTPKIYSYKPSYTEIKKKYPENTEKNNDGLSLELISMKIQNNLKRKLVNCSELAKNDEKLMRKIKAAGNTKKFTVNNEYKKLSKDFFNKIANTAFCKVKLKEINKRCQTAVIPNVTNYNDKKLVRKNIKFFKKNLIPQTKACHINRAISPTNDLKVKGSIKGFSIRKKNKNFSFS